MPGIALSALHVLVHYEAGVTLAWEGTTYKQLLGVQVQRSSSAGVWQNKMGFCLEELRYQIGYQERAVGLDQRMGIQLRELQYGNPTSREVQLGSIGIGPQSPEMTDTKCSGQVVLTAGSVGAAG